MEKSGFTLLEVALFLAITSLLALIAFAGLGPRLRNVRFTDAVRTLDSSTQKQLSDFQDGVNNRAATSKCVAPGGVPSLTNSGTGQNSGTSEDCILNGKVALFEKTKVTYYPVVSARKSTSSCSPNPTYGDLFCYNPTVVGFSSVKQTVDYSNGAVLKGSGTAALLYLQDPNGTQASIIPINPVTLSAISDSHKIDFSVDVDGQSLPKVCLTLSGREAQIEYSTNSLKPKITFEGCA